MIDWRQKLQEAATAPKRADCMSIEDANLWITVLLNEIDRLRADVGVRWSGFK